MHDPQWKEIVDLPGEMNDYSLSSPSTDLVRQWQSEAVHLPYASAYSQHIANQSFNYALERAQEWIANNVGERQALNFQSDYKSQC